MTWPLPSIAVVVPTRNRPHDAVECARSILACTGPSFELVIVNQSDGEETVRELAVLADARMRVIRSRGQGASAGRNQGVAESQAPIIAFTDDDCRVPPDWLEKIEGCFACDPALALLCGRVQTPPLEDEAYAAAFEASAVRMTPDLLCSLGDIGISANMGARRDALSPLGWFDEALSPGTPLQAGEDFDLVIRALGAGLRVRNVAEVEVLHVGVRRGADARRLRLGYSVAVGACFFKHARLGNRAARRIFVENVQKHSWHVLKAVSTNRRPFGLQTLRSFLWGAAATWRFRVDPGTRLFVDRATGRRVRRVRQA